MHTPYDLVYRRLIKRTRVVQGVVAETHKTIDKTFDSDGVVSGSLAVSRAWQIVAVCRFQGC